MLCVCRTETDLQRASMACKGFGASARQSCGSSQCGSVGPAPPSQSCGFLELEAPHTVPSGLSPDTTLFKSHRWDPVGRAQLGCHRLSEAGAPRHLWSIWPSRAGRNWAHTPPLSSVQPLGKGRRDSPTHTPTPAPGHSL